MADAFQLPAGHLLGLLEIRTTGGPPDLSAYEPPPVEPAMKMTCIICGGDDFRRVFSKQGYDFVRCPTCRVMRLDPIPSLEELRKHYEARTAHGNYEMDVSRGRDQSIADTLDFIVRQTGPRPGLKLLDIGCFDGKLMDFANDRLGWDCWGVEL